MVRGWRVLDMTSVEGVVGGTRGRITIDSERTGRQEIPAEEVGVVLIGTGTNLASSALHYLAKHDVAFLAADWRGVPFAGLHAWSGHSRVAARQIAQAGMSLPRKKSAWMQLVRAKVLGQAATLEPVNATKASRLRLLAAAVRSGDPANVEGSAARIYWRSLFAGYPGFIRDKDGWDDVNAVLNYGYTVLRGFVIRAVSAAGLAPPLGVFHRGRSNYFNLVDDLIEPFRPAIDWAVVGFGIEADPRDPSIKKALVAAATQAFTGDGRRIPAVLDDLAQQFGQYVEGDIDRLRVPIWSGPKVLGEATAGDGQE